MRSRARVLRTFNTRERETIRGKKAAETALARYYLPRTGREGKSLALEISV